MDVLERLFDEIYGPKLTPSELLENVALSNYISVDFFKQDDLLVGISKCTLSNGQVAEFTYKFDKSNKLQHIKSKVNSEINEIYDRTKEIEKYYTLARELLHFSNPVAV